MQVQQMIRASADVLTITTLAPGNVYKRVDEGGYNGTKLMFGVVQDVMNNGEDAAVTALEYEADYGAGVKATLRVWTGSKPVALFPATPDEVTAHIAELRVSAKRAVDQAEKDLAGKREAFATVVRLANTVGELSAPQTTTEYVEIPA